MGWTRQTMRAEAEVSGTAVSRRRFVKALVVVGAGAGLQLHRVDLVGAHGINGSTRRPAAEWYLAATADGIWGVTHDRAAAQGRLATQQAVFGIEGGIADGPFSLTKRADVVGIDREA